MPLSKSHSSNKFSSSSSLLSVSSAAGAPPVAVGIDLGSYNTRIAYLAPTNTNTTTLNTSTNSTSSTDQPLLPVCVHNNDGNRATRTPLPTETEAPSLHTFVQQHILPLAREAAHTKELHVVVSIPNEYQKKSTTTGSRDDLATVHDLAVQVGGVPSGAASLSVITEAAAICLAYGPHLLKTKRILVVDGGASGIKTAVMTTTADGLWCPEAVATLPTVSGTVLVDTFGQAIAQSFETKYRLPRHEVWTNSKKARKKLRAACQDGLTTLHLRQAMTVTIHVESLYDGLDCSVALSKAKWEHLASPYVQQTKTFLRDQVGNKTLDAVVVSGTMHAWLTPIVQTLFPGKLVATTNTTNTLDPAEAICIGCTLQANLWMRQQQVASETTTLTNTPIAAGLPPTMEVPISPIAIAVKTKRNTTTSTLIAVGVPLPAAVQYDLSTSSSSASSSSTSSASSNSSEHDDDDHDEEMKGRQEDDDDDDDDDVEIWQIHPTQKHLATVRRSSEEKKLSSIRLLLTAQKQLRIAVVDATNSTDSMIVIG